MLTILQGLSEHPNLPLSCSLLWVLALFPLASVSCTGLVSGMMEHQWTWPLWALMGNKLHNKSQKSREQFCLFHLFLVLHNLPMWSFTNNALKLVFLIFNLCKFKECKSSFCCSFLMEETLLPYFFPYILAPYCP